MATICTGVLRLVTRSRPCLRKDIPETLLLDTHRINHMQREYTKLVMTISLLALVNVQLKTWKLLGESTSMVIMKTIVVEVTKNIPSIENMELVIDTTDKVLQLMCGATTKEFKDFRDIMYACMTRGEIMHVVAKRLHSFMGDTISLSARFDVFESISDIQVALDNHNVPAVAILILVRLREYVRAIQQIVQANSKVHRTLYRELIDRTRIRMVDEFAKIQTPALCLVAGFDGQVSRRKY